MKQETRNIPTLLAHLYDQSSSAQPDYLGRSPASPKDIAEALERSHTAQLSNRDLRRRKRR